MHITLLAAALAVTCSHPLETFIAEKRADGLVYLGTTDVAGIVAPDCSDREGFPSCGWDHELTMLKGKLVLRWLVKDNCIVSMPMQLGIIVPKAGA